MSTISDLQGSLDAKRAQLAEVFNQAGPDLDFAKVNVIDGDTTAKVEHVRNLNAQIDDAAKQLEGFRALEGIREDNKAAGVVDKSGRALAASASAAAQNSAEPFTPKSLGELFVASPAYTGRDQRGNGNGPVARLDLGGRVSDMRATLFQTSAGYATETTRTGRVVENAQRPLQVIDLIPSGRTSQSAVVYMEETTFTNSAAETAEGGTFAESALALTQRSSTVQKVATFIPVTDEQLEDVDGIQSYLDNRLGFMLRQRLDSQILVGNGTAPNLRGINNVSGIQTQAKGADPTPDAIYKAMTLVRVTGRSIPSGIIINPTDWQDVKLLRTADGIYIWGNPADNAPDRIWGLNVALSDAQTLNTAVVGDFANYSELVMRRDVEIQISNSHSTFFIEGKQAVRADMRVALVWYRPTAFCTVTGI